MPRLSSYKADPKPQLGKPFLTKNANHQAVLMRTAQSFLISQLLGICSWGQGREGGDYLPGCVQRRPGPGPYHSLSSFIH